MLRIQINDVEIAVSVEMTYCYPGCGKVFENFSCSVNERLLANVASEFVVQDRSGVGFKIRCCNSLSSWSCRKMRLKQLGQRALCSGCVVEMFEVIGNDESKF